MSATSMTQEVMQLVDEFGFNWADIQWLTINAMKSAFIPFDERLEIINKVVKPAYGPLAL